MCGKLPDHFLGPLASANRRTPPPLPSSATSGFNLTPSGGTEAVVLVGNELLAKEGEAELLPTDDSEDRSSELEPSTC